MFKLNKNVSEKQLLNLGFVCKRRGHIYRYSFLIVYFVDKVVSVEELYFNAETANKIIKMVEKEIIVKEKI